MRENLAWCTSTCSFASNCALRSGFEPSCERMSGLKAFISAQRMKSSGFLRIFAKVVYPPMSLWVSPKPHIESESDAGMTDGRPKSTVQSVC